MRSEGVEPSASGILGRPLYLSEYEHMEPLTRIERVAFSIRGRRSAK